MLIEKGHEVCLHGFTHLNEDIPPIGSWHWFVGNVYTRREGEFYNVSCREARARLAEGMQMFQSASLVANGFIAPGWLLSRESKHAVQKCGFAYTTSLRRFILFRGHREIHAPVIVFSARSQLRRWISLMWGSAWFRAHRGKTILRIAIHPDDMRYPLIRTMAFKLIERSLLARTPITYSELSRRMGRE
jgi:hypothetical protein